MIRVGAKLLLPAVLLVLAFSGSAANANQGTVKRCWPAAEACPAKEYERKAAQAASRYAREKFDKDFPASMWTVVCYPGPSTRRIECSVHSRDETPYDCVGGMVMKKRDGRWRAKDIEMSCAV
jgi:hypothetical protein